MENSIEDILASPVSLTNTLRSAAQEAGSYRNECADLKKQADRLSFLLSMVARVSRSGGAASSSSSSSSSGGLYRRPTMRIMAELTKALEKALALVMRCKRNGIIKRVITITSGNDFRRVGQGLDNSIGDITWLLSVCAAGEDGKTDDYLGLPPIASMDPMLAFIWEHIAILQRGSPEEKKEAATALASASRDNDRNSKLIVEEDGVPPLLKLLTDGDLEARETSARALGYLIRDEDRVKQMVVEGAVPIFVKVLSDSPIKVQVKIAWIIAEMAAIYPQCQQMFVDDSVIRPLVSILSFDTLEESVKMAMHTLVASSIAANKAGAFPEDEVPSVCAAYVTKPKEVINLEIPSRITMAPGKPGSLPPKRMGFPDAKTVGSGSRYMSENGNVRVLTQREIYKKEWENADPQLKAELKAEAARALWKLCEGNAKVSKSITETRALLCLAKLMEHGKGAVQRNAIKAVTAIAIVAEQDTELRRAAFKMSSPAAKATIEQLVRIIEEDGQPDLQPACIKAIGCLSRTFPARESRVIKPLVKHLEGREEAIREAVIALEKFACFENYLHKEHSKTIIEASGEGPLVQLIYFGEGQTKLSAITLMCHLGLYIGESEALAKAEALAALEWASKNASLMQYPTLHKLLPQAIAKLEMYQGKGVRHHLDNLHNKVYG